MATMPMITRLDCVTIEGLDARRFAQTQLSGDVEALAPGRWQWNAWLTAQGRVRAVMHLAAVDDGDRLLAVLRGGDAKAVRDGLATYRLRSRVELAAAGFCGRAGDPLPSGTVHRDGETIVLGLGPRSLRLDPGPAPVEIDVAASAAWRLQDIRAGWPTLDAAGTDRFLPPALGLERLGAVSFRKGCFPGQEIAARLRYRGGHKHCLARLRGPSALPLGDALEADGGVLATVLASAPDREGHEMLAVIPVTTPKEINLLGHVFHILERFEA